MSGATNSAGASGRLPVAAAAASQAATSTQRSDVMNGAVRAAAGSAGNTDTSAAESGAAASAGRAGAAAGSGAAGLPAGKGGTQPSPSGGAGTAADAKHFGYLLGADITDQESAPSEVRARLLSSMIAHGFNAIRLRTFVDPRAADGYDQEHGYADLAHTIEFGKQIKAAGMFLAIDFHYSDNWADPGKQCVPIAWQHYASIAELAAALGDYTRDAITQLVAADARPDLVQIGKSCPCCALVAYL